MRMREKLIELIASTEYGNGLVGENFQEGFIAKIADHLIANGVTFDHEQAYKNGYTKGYANALAYARRELRLIGEGITELQQTVKELQNAASAAAERRC